MLWLRHGYGTTPYLQLVFFLVSEPASFEACGGLVRIAPPAKEATSEQRGGSGG